MSKFIYIGPSSTAVPCMDICEQIGTIHDQILLRACMTTQALIFKFLACLQLIVGVIICIISGWYT
jgi:hypothetical protein